MDLTSVGGDASCVSPRQSCLECRRCRCLDRPDSLDAWTHCQAPLGVVLGTQPCSVRTGLVLKMAVIPDLVKAAWVWSTNRGQPSTHADTRFGSSECCPQPVPRSVPRSDPAAPMSYDRVHSGSHLSPSGTRRSLSKGTMLSKAIKQAVCECHRKPRHNFDDDPVQLHA
jgi:hypothetical protein